VSLTRSHLRVSTLAHLPILKMVRMRATRSLSEVRLLLWTAWTHAAAHIHAWHHAHVLLVRLETLVGGGVLHHVPWTRAAGVALLVHLWLGVWRHWRVTLLLGVLRVLTGHGAVHEVGAVRAVGHHAGHHLLLVIGWIWSATLVALGGHCRCVSLSVSKIGLRSGRTLPLTGMHHHRPVRRHVHLAVLHIGAHLIPLHLLARKLGHRHILHLPVERHLRLLKARRVLHRPVRSEVWHARPITLWMRVMLRRYERHTL